MCGCKMHAACADSVEDDCPACDKFIPGHKNRKSKTRAVSKASSPYIKAYSSDEDDDDDRGNNPFRSAFGTKFPTTTETTTVKGLFGETSTAAAAGPATLPLFGEPLAARSSSSLSACKPIKTNADLLKCKHAIQTMKPLDVDGFTNVVETINELIKKSTAPPGQMTLPVIQKVLITMAYMRGTLATRVNSHVLELMLQESNWDIMTEALHNATSEEARNLDDLIMFVLSDDVNARMLGNVSQGRIKIYKLFRDKSKTYPLSKADQMGQFLSKFPVKTAEALANFGITGKTVSQQINYKSSEADLKAQLRAVLTGLSTYPYEEIAEMKFPGEFGQALQEAQIDYAAIWAQNRNAK
jgi:hypothetical protein